MLKPSWLSLTVSLALVGGFFVMAGLAWRGGPEPPPTSGLAITLSVDKSTYRPGDTIQVTLEVANRTAEPITLVFSTSQRFDLAIEDDEGNELWRWSRGKLFLQVLGEETLGSEGPPLAYHTEAPGPADPGRYRLHGALATAGQAFRASTFFNVH